MSTVRKVEVLPPEPSWYSVSTRGNPDDPLVVLRERVRRLEDAQDLHTRLIVQLQGIAKMLMDRERNRDHDGSASQGKEAVAPEGVVVR